MLGQLPGGKLVLQGSQLAALTQARAAGQAGGQPKVLTIQLQVQQQPNQQGGVKVRKKFRFCNYLILKSFKVTCFHPGEITLRGLDQSFILLSQYQLVSGAGNTGSPQVLQISQGQGGQRVAIPLKMLLQPQVNLQINTDNC